MNAKWDNERLKNELSDEIRRLFKESLSREHFAVPDCGGCKDETEYPYEYGVEIVFSGTVSGKFFLLFYGDIIDNLAAGWTNNKKCAQAEKWIALTEFSGMICEKILWFLCGENAAFEIGPPKPIAVEDFNVSHLNKVSQSQVPLRNGYCELWLFMDNQNESLRIEPKAKILIVDDLASARRMLKKILTAAGHEVVGEACNVEEAVEKFKKLKPDLVTVDIVMPLESGLDAVKKIIQHDAEAKIIVISALNQSNVINDLFSNGVKSYLNKPFDSDELIRAVSQALKQESSIRLS